MTKTETILALCEAATQAEQYRWEQPLFAKDAALKDLSDACNPAEIRRMVEVMEMMRDGLRYANEDLAPLDVKTTCYCPVCNAIAAFDAWQGGDE